MYIKPSEERAAVLLKWPGGKSWIAPRLSKFFRENIQSGGSYIEPFLGGGSVFFTLAPDKAILSDLNPKLIEFFEIVREMPSRLISSLSKLSNDKDTYYRMRQSEPKSALGRATRFLFLNRTCWGGVYRENRKGEFNVPFGNSGRNVCAESVIHLASSRLQNSSLVCSDFEHALINVTSKDTIYIDPPYSIGFGKDGFSRYNALQFTWDDHLRLAHCCRKADMTGALICVSSAMHPLLLKEFQGWWLVACTRKNCVSRLPASRNIVSEALIFNRPPTALDFSPVLIT